MKELMIVILWFLVMVAFIKNLQQDDKIEQLRQQCVMKEGDK